MHSHQSLRKLVKQLGIVLMVITASTSPGFAQVTQVAGDGTTNTLVNGNSLTTCGTGLCQVTGGTQVGNSLFHSFEHFSVQDGDEINFVGTNVDTIFNRVTGASSFIDGTISTTTGGVTDVFLLNPQGIIFGENATLNIDGSFVATTADRIVFDNDAFFSATDTSLSSGLLRVSTPIGLQHGTSPGSIKVNGSGHQMTTAPFSGAFDRTNRPVGLQVNPGQTLALVGGPLLFTGGNLTASDGRIELGSVNSNQVVALQEQSQGIWVLDYGNVANFQTIQLDSASSLDTSGIAGGSIHISGQQLNLTDGSVIVANTQGIGTGTGINVNAESVAIQGSVGSVISGLYSDAELTATGQAGDISLQSQELSILDEGKVSTITFGAGSTGNISVETNQLNMLGASFIVSSALPFVPGNTGDVNVTAEQITLRDGAQIVTSNFGTGSTGGMQIEADTILLTGESPDGAQKSGFQAMGFLSPGGQLVVDADYVQLLAGAQITADTFGPGAGGEILLTARQLDLSGNSAADTTPSFVSTSVFPGATGEGGDLFLNVDQLRVTDGGQIGVTTFGDGDAGTLYITADTVELAGLGPGGRSGLFGTAINGNGDGGNLELKANRLAIQDGAIVSAGNFQSLNLVPPGQGSPGNILIMVDSLALDNGSTITADTAVGDQGNLTLITDTLTLQNGSRISTNAQGSSTGGNITIDAIALIAIDNSDISANAQQGNGGRIIVNADLILGTDFRAQLTPLSDITASSDLGPSFSGSVELNTPEYEPEQGLTLLPASPIDNTGQITRQCTSTGNSLIVSGRGGVAPSPNEVMRNNTVWTDLRLLPEQLSYIETDGTNNALKRDRISTLNATNFSQTTYINEAQTILMENGQIKLIAAASANQVGNLPIADCSTQRSQR